MFLRPQYSVTDSDLLISEKKKMRKIMLDKRSEISSNQKDEKIFNKLCSLPVIKNADIVLTYISYNSEVDTRMLIDFLCENKIRVAAPKTYSDGIMSFVEISSLSDTKCGKYGILEPLGLDIANITDKTVCIIPALSYTLRGERLGYGGGYYDRFLSKHPELSTIGICYDEMISDKLPCGENDIKINTVITEKRMVICSAEG